MSAEDGSVGGVPLAMLDTAAILRSSADDVNGHRSTVEGWRNRLTGVELGDPRTGASFDACCDAWAIALARLAEALQVLQQEVGETARGLLEAGGSG
jgi:hypothetical protein